jgi:radical SAM protein with 4Fe4S-binding SPASM domain
VSPIETDILRQFTEAGLKPPKAVTLAVTNQCNLSCRHCWPDSGPDPNAPMVPKDRVLALMTGFTALGAEKIVITGGEPLTHPDWVELLSFACAQPGVGEVRLQTNAILITPPLVAPLQALKDQGLVIQTSLEGATPPVHDQIRGAGSFEHTLKGLQLLVDGGLAHRICITFTEMQHNFDELPQLLKMADGMGVGQFVTGTLVHGGRAMQAIGLRPPTPAQYESLLARYERDAAFRDRYQRIGNIAAIEWFNDSGDGGNTCCTFIETPYVTAEGNLYPCVMLHADDFAATGVYDRPLSTALSEKIESWSQLAKISHSRHTQLDACRDCQNYARCAAGCMGRAFSAYGDFFAAEDRCRLRQAVYRQNACET